jgi:hypothetical protein
MVSDAASLISWPSLRQDTSGVRGFIALLFGFIFYLVNRQE